MKTRKLRDIEVSAVGMGCMAFSHGYGKIPTEEYSIEAIRNAYQYGCTFFDTAEVYSPNLAGIGHNLIDKTIICAEKDNIKINESAIKTAAPCGALRVFCGFVSVDAAVR